MSDQTIKQTLEVVDKFSKSFTDYEKGAEGAGDKSEKAVPKIGRFEGALGKAGKAMKGFALAWVGMKGLKMGQELAEGAVQADATGRAYTDMARRFGISSEQMMRDMKRVSKGMVDDTSLQMKALDAMSIGLTQGDFLHAVEYATGRAQALGKDASQEIEKTVRALATGSERAFREVGLSADDARGAIEKMKEASMMGGGENSPAGQIAKYKAEITNIKDQIGTQLIPILETWHRVQAGLMKVASNTLTAYQDIINLIASRAVGGGKSIYQLEGEALEKVLDWQVKMRYAEGEERKHLEKMKPLLQAKYFYNVEEQLSLNELIEIRNKLGQVQSKHTRDELKARSESQKAIKEQIAVVKETADVNITGVKGWSSLSHKAYEIDASNEERKKKWAEARADREKRIHQEKMMQNAIAYQEDADRQAQLLADIEVEVQARKQAVFSIVNSSVSAFTAVQSIHGSKMRMIQAESNAEIDRINKSRMSEQQKASAIKRIQDAQKAREIESAERAVKMARLMGLISVATTTANSYEAMTAQLRDSRVPSVVARLAFGGAVLGAGLAAVAQVKSAQASIPQREHGGLMRAGKLYEVGERGKNEMFSAGGRSYMIPSQSGRMTPNVNNSYGGNNYNVSVNVHGNGDKREIQSAVLDALYDLDRNNRVDYGRMANMRRAFR